MKKTLFILIAAIIALSVFTSCNGNVNAVVPSLETVYDVSTGTRAVNGTDVLSYGVWAPNSSNTALIPWTGDVKGLAKADGTLRFYFMAGEGTQVTGVGEKIGDCCLVIFPNGETMLIDACTVEGNPGYIPTLVANIKRLGISKLDYVLITHQHRDHYGGYVVNGGIGDSFTVGKLYYNGMDFHDGFSKKLAAMDSSIKAKADSKGTPIEALQEGDKLTIGDVTIDVFNPIKGAGSETYKNGDTTQVNNSSIVLLMTYGNVKALFTGDLYQSGMQAVYDRYGSKLKADILKIPHHGHSETSILDAFAAAVDPEIAVVSSSIALSDNVYKLYRQYGATLLSDYNEGYVILSTDGNKIYTKTSRVRQTDYYDVYDKYYGN
ncbi:MAG: MBL fold metallo-hydrolase [Sphaerochaetaceae bacterium]|nr:MBL fold metallo-hydrolase [Sphaerochaetaceae bacterium]